MAIPTHDELIIPFLEVLSDNKQHSRKELVEILGKKFSLTEDEINEIIPSGSKKFEGRVGWARTYLKASKLIESPERGIFKITERGQKALIERPVKILQYLRQYPEYMDFIGGNKNENTKKNEEVITRVETPDEMLANAQELYLNNLKSELLNKLKSIDPIQFERIVLILMEKMNYGVGSMTPTSHDGGIDGIINEDELGLEKSIYKQKDIRITKLMKKKCRILQVL